MHKAAKAQLFSTGIAPLSDLILSSFATWASFRQTPAFAFATFLLSEFFLRQSLSSLIVVWVVTFDAEGKIGMIYHFIGSFTFCKLVLEKNLKVSFQ
jgi:hypothetical protein